MILEENHTKPLAACKNAVYEHGEKRGNCIRAVHKMENPVKKKE